MKILLPISMPLLLLALPLQAQSESMDHNQHSMSAMDKPAADARDPHEYSNGFTLERGPYVLEGPRLLKMADEHHFWAVMADRLEYAPEEEVGAYELSARYGSTYNRLALKLEGEVEDDRLAESQSELLWQHAVSAYFDSHLGVRFDEFEEGRSRQWLAFGISGLAPYWFETDLTAYVGEHGNTALSFEAEYEWLLTQRLVLQPRIELNFYGQHDEENHIGSGLSDAAAGLRLRYEFSRQFAPYIGIERSRLFGATADYARADGEHSGETLAMVGLRFWF